MTKCLNEQSFYIDKSEEKLYEYACRLDHNAIKILKNKKKYGEEESISDYFLNAMDNYLSSKNKG